MLNLSNYAALLIFVTVGAGAMAVILLISFLFREKRGDPERQEVYECGMRTIGTPYVSPDFRFYVYALLFVVFDVEVVFLLPWAIQVRTLGWGGYIAVVIFIGILFVPFVYAWKKGALEWE